MIIIRESKYLISFLFFQRSFTFFASDFLSLDTSSSASLSSLLWRWNSPLSDAMATSCTESDLCRACILELSVVVASDSVW